MSGRSGSSRASGGSGRSGGRESDGPGAGPPPRRAPAPCFKLRFAAQREPGRSYVSAVKPLGLPDVVTAGRDGSEALSGEERAAERVRAAFESGPRDRLPQPTLSSHEYGWWSWTAARADPMLRHHIRDSWWLRERVRVLVHDNELRRR